MANHRVSMDFEDGTRYSFIDEGDWLEEGKWRAPYPNDSEDSFVFGLIEAYGQGEGVVATLLWQSGEPTTIEVCALDFEQ